MKRLKYFAELIALLGLVACLTGCHSAPTYWPDPPGMTSVSNPPGSPPPTWKGSTGSPLRMLDLIHVGDTLQISWVGVAGSDPPIQPYTDVVKEDGSFRLPQLPGSIIATNKTVTQLQKELQTAYERILRNTTVTVRVGERYFYAEGEVARRGQILYSGQQDIVTAIAAAGGFTEFANKKQLRLTHENGKVEIIDYTKAILDPSYKFPVFPGDKIYVKRKLF